jgi:hypothetical protein
VLDERRERSRDGGVAISDRDGVLGVELSSSDCAERDRDRK